MKTKVNGVEIELTPEQIKQIEEQTKPKGGRFIPKYGEQYFYSVSDGYVYGDINNTRIDRERISLGNCYRTKKDAEKARDRQLAIVRVLDYIEIEFGTFNPDWKNKSQVKYHIWYSHSSKKLGYEGFYGFKISSPIGYLRTRKHAIKLIKDCREDLELIYK